MSLSAEVGAGLRERFDSLAEATDKNRLTHGLHPYPAKFIPHIPRWLCAEFCTEADRVVWDPMCGSGTTLVEAALLGHRAVGTDLNPVATLVASAKTTGLSPRGVRQLESVAASVDDLAVLATSDASELQRVAGELPEFRNREKWFEASVSAELCAILSAVRHVGDLVARRLARCVFSSIVVAVSNQESETRWRSVTKEVEAGETCRRFARKLRESVAQVSSFVTEASGSASVLRCDSRSVPLRSASVDFVVTSPPYANSHDYYLYNKLRLFWLGYDVKSVQLAEIGSRNRHSDMGADVDHYLDAMSSIFLETRRVLRTGGHAAFVVADAVIRGDLYRMDELFIARASRVGLGSVDFRYSFDHRQFNASFQRGFGTRTTKLTHVLVFS